MTLIVMSMKHIIIFHFVIILYCRCNLLFRIYAVYFFMFRFAIVPFCVFILYFLLWWFKANAAPTPSLIKSDTFTNNHRARVLDWAAAPPTYSPSQYDENFFKRYQNRVQCTYHQKNNVQTHRLERALFAGIRSLVWMKVSLFVLNASGRRCQMYMTFNLASIFCVKYPSSKDRFIFGWLAGWLAVHGMVGISWQQ